MHSRRGSAPAVSFQSSSGCLQTRRATIPAFEIDPHASARGVPRLFQAVSALQVFCSFLRAAGKRMLLRINR